jgi:hypothetical protein
MTMVIMLGLITLREGLALRRGRLQRRSRDSARHRRLAQGFVALVALGYLSGLLSMAKLHPDPLFDSVHSLLTSGALTLLIFALGLGKRLERRPGPAVRQAHLACGATGLLIALLAAVAGIAILP